MASAKESFQLPETLCMRRGYKLWHFKRWTHRIIFYVVDSINS